VFCSRDFRVVNLLCAVLIMLRGLENRLQGRDLEAGVEILSGARNDQSVCILNDTLFAVKADQCRAVIVWRSVDIRE